MAGAFSHSGLVDALEETRDWRNTWVLCLFKNDVTPDVDFDATDVIEANFVGYSRISLDSWGAAYENAAGIAQSDEVLRTFTCTAGTTPNTIYGYFLLDGAGNYKGGQRNSAGGTLINAAAQQYPVLPIVTLDNV